MNRIFYLAFLLFLLASMALPGAAKGETVVLPFNQARLNIQGFYQKSEEAKVLLSRPNLWSTEEWGACFSENTCQQQSDGGRIIASVEKSVVSVKENHFRLPIMEMKHPLDPHGANIPFVLRATDDLQGVFLPSGAMEISGPLAIDILLGLSFAEAEGGANPFYRCRFPLGNVSLSTGTSLPAGVGFQGTPWSFASEAKGALTASWETTTGFIPLVPPGDPADALGYLSQACMGTPSIIMLPKSALWLGHGLTGPAPYPICPKGQVGTYPDCQSLKNEVSIRVKGPRTIKSGRWVTYRASVHNKSFYLLKNLRVDLSAQGIKGSGKKIEVLEQNRKGEVAFKIRPQKKGKTRLHFSLSYQGVEQASVQKTVRVR